MEYIFLYFHVRIPPVYIKNTCIHSKTPIFCITLKAIDGLRGIKLSEKYVNKISLKKKIFAYVFVLLEMKPTTYCNHKLIIFSGKFEVKTSRI